MLRSVAGLSRGARVGRYEVLEVVGRGASGEVARARTADGRVVALKLLQRTDPLTLSRFARERRLLESLGLEQGFVPLLDAGTDQQQGPFIAMPFIEGGTLAQRLARGPLSVVETRALGIKVARALGEAHKRGVVHRDLKPSNILLDARGAPLIADLGLAKHFAKDAPGAEASRDLTRTGAIFGTAGYMAPEQLGDSRAAGPAADVFALGVVLYECLAKEPPFFAASLVELLVLVEEGRFQPLRARRRDVPARLARTIERCLARDPDERFQDGEALAQALEASARRSPLPLYAGALVAAALLVGGGALAGAKWAAGRAPPAAASPPPAPPAPPPPAPPPSPPRDAKREALELARGALAKARKSPEDALADAQKAQGLDASCALAWLASARARYERAVALVMGPSSHAEDKTRAALSEALTDVERALQLDDSLAAAYGLRGTIKLLIFGAAAATEDLDRALALDPREPLALLMRAQTKDANDTEAALGDVEAALAGDPESSLGWSLRGGLHHRQKRDILAIDDLARALELDPRSPFVLGQRAALLLDLSRWKEALADADRALALDERLLVAWFVRGTVHMEQDKDWATAAGDFTHALEIDGRDADALIGRGRCRGKLHDLDGALADFTRAVELDRKDHRALGFRSGIYEEKGDAAAAIADAKECIRLAPGSASAAKCRDRLARLEK